MGVLGRFTDGIRKRRGPALQAQESVALTGAGVPTYTAVSAPLQYGWRQNQFKANETIRSFLSVKPGTMYATPALADSVILVNMRAMQSASSVDRLTGEGKKSPMEYIALDVHEH